MRTRKMQNDQSYMRPDGSLDLDRAEREMRHRQSREFRRIVVALFRLFQRAAAWRPARTGVTRRT